MSNWFLGLDTAAQAAIASAIASSFVIGIVAVLGFWITFKTSTAANERVAAITKENNFLQLSFAGDAKIAEMRQKWIDDLREHIAEFGAGIASDMMLLQFGKQPAGGRTQYLYNYIFLKLNRTEDNHNRIVKLMGQMLSTTNYLKSSLDTISDEEKNQALRNFQSVFDELNVITSAVLKEEWNRVKLETKNTITAR